MIKSYNNIYEFKQDLTVVKEKKELYGEVYTPFTLIDKIISLIPINNFKNIHKKWLDIGAGTGYFSVYLYFKLFENLKNDFINVNRFNIEANFPKKTTSLSVIDRQIQPFVSQALGLCFIF